MILSPRPTKHNLSLPGFIMGNLLGALLVWGLSAAWVEFLPFSVLPARYARNIAVQNMISRCADTDVAIFGDSRARSGINPNELGASALNLAEGGYNPAVDFYRAQQMLRCAHRPRLVILSYSVLLYRLIPNFLMSDLYIDRLIANQDIQEIVDTIAKYNDWGILASRGGESTPPFLSRTMGLRSILYRIDFPLFYAPSMLMSLETGVLIRLHNNEQTYDTTMRNRGQYPFDEAERSNAIFSDAEITQYPRSVVMDLYLEKLISMLTVNGIRVLIVTMPINRPTFEAISLGDRQAHAAYLLHFAAAYPNVGVAEPVLAPWPAEMFSDGSGHPNGRGQVEVTRLVNRCVTAILASMRPIDPKTCSMTYNAF